MKSILGCSFWGKHSPPPTPKWTKEAHELLACTRMSAEQVPALLVTQHQRGSGAECKRDMTQAHGEAFQVAPAQSLPKPVWAWSPLRWLEKDMGLRGFEGHTSEILHFTEVFDRVTD